jgi:organic hydroperoxide reductase OsmC/OhrA
MSQHSAIITWERGDATFTDKRYSRAHRWDFDGGVTVPASSSPHVVPVPYSVAANVDPEEAYVAALSSCHMLWFLGCAAQRGFTVALYRDEAVGVMGKNAAGQVVMSRLTLRPHVTFTGSLLPGDADVSALHHEAHESCFLANSVKTEIETQGSWAVHQDSSSE